MVLVTSWMPAVEEQRKVGSVARQQLVLVVHRQLPTGQVPTVPLRIWTPPSPEREFYACVCVLGGYVCVCVSACSCVCQGSQRSLEKVWIL